MTLTERTRVPAPTGHLKDLLRIADLAPGDLPRLLSLAADAKRHRHRYARALAGELVVLAFDTPSTRTRLAFSAAAARLGAVPVVVAPAETIEDTARAASSYAAALVVRTAAHDDLRRLADAATIPVVNALPIQSLADLLTLRDHFGRLAGLHVAYVGDGTSGAHSLMEACALAGAHITVRVAEDPEVAGRDADVVHADGSLSLGDAGERAALENRLHIATAVLLALTDRSLHGSGR